MVTIGVDTHKATLAASAIDEAGRERGAETFPNDGEGHAQLLRWARMHGPERRFGIEGSGSYGAALARMLAASGEPMVQVPAVLTDRERRHLRRAGKSDPGDALAIARVALREKSLGPAPMPGITEDQELLVDAREQCLAERTRVANQLHAHLVVLTPGYKREIRNLSAARYMAAVAGLLKRVGGVRAELARAELVRLRALDAESGALEGRIRVLVQLSGSSLAIRVASIRRLRSP